MNSQDLKKMQRKIEKLTKKNPYDLSEKSIMKMKLTSSTRFKIGEAISDIMQHYTQEIVKLREGTFQFLASEYDSSDESEYANIQKYGENQLELIEHTLKNFESSLLSMLSTFDEELGKTDTN